MVQAFVGLVGGGKSFCSTRRMMAYMAQGGRVASNIRLTGYDDETGDLVSTSPVVSFLRSIGWDYQPKQYIYIPYDTMVSDPAWYRLIPAGYSRDRRTLCVVDEATDLFDTLDGGKLRTDSGYRGLFHFLRLSRHAHIDVLFVCQDLNTINSRLKNLVSNIWRSTDMRHFNIGIFKFGFPFDVFLLQLFDRTGKNLIQREYVRKDPRVFECYESETFGGCLGVKWDGVAVSNGHINQRKGKQMSKLAWCLVALSVGLSCVGLFRRPETVVDLAGVNSRLDILERAFPGMISNRVVVPPSVVVTNVPIAVPSAGTNGYYRGVFVFRSGWRDKWVEFDGLRIAEGEPCEYGRVICVSDHYVICRADDGSYNYLLPSTPPAPPPRFTSSGGRGAGR